MNLHVLRRATGDGRRTSRGMLGATLLGFFAAATAACAPFGSPDEREGDEPREAGARAASGPTAATALDRLAKLRGREIVARSPSDAVRVTPSDSAGVHVEDVASGVGVRVRLDGARGGEPVEVDGSFVFPSGGPGGADVVVVPTATGAEDWVIYGAAPARSAARYALGLRNVAGLRLVAGVLELLDATGTPRLRARPPYVVDAAGQRHAARFDLRDCAADDSARAPWGRPVRAPGRDECAVDVIWDGAAVTYPAALDPVWELTTGSLAEARRWHTATQLEADPASPVLFAGGFDGTSAVQVAELYQPKSRTFAATGALVTARGAHAAALLQDGGVLVAGGAGGVSSSATGDDTNGEIGTLERYNPATGVWSQLPGALSPPRSNLTATTLNNGKVLLVGGQDTLGQPLKNTAIFDPSLPSLDPNGPALAFARAGHTATDIDGIRVLFVGGYSAVDANSQKTTEIYDALFNTMTAGPSMTFSRAYHTATRLLDGRILIVGGISKPNDPANAKIHETSEIYTASAGIGSIAAGPSMTKERSYHAAARLETGGVVIAGGFGGDLLQGSPHGPRAESELFSPGSNVFTAGPDMSGARLFHTLLAVNPAGSLVDGEAVPAQSVLAAGGVDVQGSNGPALATAELFVRPLADACTLGVECASGHCSDGVCCDEACGSECDSCEASLKEGGAETGICGPSKKGVAQGKQLVDGPDLGTQCSANVVSSYTCDGAGDKVIYFSESCNGNTCDAQGEKCIETCDGVTTKCLSDAWCEIPAGELLGKCAPKRDLGETCDSGVQCKNPNDLSVDGFCIDGVCCNSPCAEICQACNLAGFAGTCVHGGTNGREPPAGNRACANATPTGDEVCAGFCDATVSPDVTECQYPDAKVLCGDQKVCACDDEPCSVGPTTQTRFACDAQGACVESPVQDDGVTAYVTDCGGHFCGEPADDGHQQCATTCASDAECLLDFFCDAGKCAPLPTTGRCDGQHTLRVPGAEDVDCAPYLCPEAETACRSECKSDLECVEPGGEDPNQVACNSDGKCEAPPVAPDLPSCSAARAPATTPSGVASLGALVAAIALGAARRRRDAIARRTGCRGSAAPSR